MGKADAFLKALHQAIPIACREIVPSGDFRQSNCYYSSSEVVFKNCYEVDEHYKDIIDGKIMLRRGWRVYSSGPGIYIAMIVSRLLGLRTEFGNTIIDPVVSEILDGLIATIEYLGYHLQLKYRIRVGNFSPKSIVINNVSLDFKCEENLCRKGGAVMPLESFIKALNKKVNTVEITL